MEKLIPYVPQCTKLQVLGLGSKPRSLIAYHLIEEKIFLKGNTIGVEALHDLSIALTACPDFRVLNLNGVDVSYFTSDTTSDL